MTLFEVETIVHTFLMFSRGYFTAKSGVNDQKIY